MGPDGGAHALGRAGLPHVLQEQGVADPVAAILSAALLLEHVGEAGAAARVRTAVWAHLRDRVEGARGTTAEVGADVVARV